MDVEPSSPGLEDHTIFTVLVTGANSGLGFAICCRLIDEFLFTRPQSQTLHLLFSTRDARKSEDTQARLRAHLKKTLRTANGITLGISLLLEKRVKIEGVLCDLTRLRTVKALAENLLRRGQKLDAVIWNAGIAGWKRVDWPKCIWRIVTDLIHASIYPDYNICDVGATTGPQLPAGTGKKSDEPKLGQVFTANVFGHYMLTHWLAPLMDGDSRAVWISSITAMETFFSLHDLQGLQSDAAYESSKRLTDLLVLTSGLPSARPHVSSFLPPPPTPAKTAARTQTPSPRPKMLLVHPGVCGTSIAGLHFFIEFFMFAAFYLARAFGSPWHPVSAYKGSISAVYAALSPPNQLLATEESEGKGKWGSTTGPFGDERVARTEVEGWGFCGKVGVVPRGSVSGVKGRYRGTKATGKEEREEFEVVGAKAWREMEGLRKDWEGRLGKVRADEAEGL